VDDLHDKDVSELSDVPMGLQSISTKTKEIMHSPKTAKSTRLGLLEKDMLNVLDTYAKYFQNKSPLKNTCL